MVDFAKKYGATAWQTTGGSSPFSTLNKRPGTRISTGYNRKEGTTVTYERDAAGNVRDVQLTARGYGTISTDEIKRRRSSGRAPAKGLKKSLPPPIYDTPAGPPNKNQSMAWGVPPEAVAALRNKLAIPGTIREAEVAALAAGLIGGINICKRFR